MSSKNATSRLASRKFGSPPTFLPTATIAIIGLGLIGGSLALALHGKCARLLGIDHRS